jgi:hypothetical protein
MMGFDSIDRKYNKPPTTPVLLQGPWFWDADFTETHYDSVAAMADAVGDSVVIKAWEGGVTRQFYVAMMAVVGDDSDAFETCEFATEEEANKWVTQREIELEAYDAAQDAERIPPPPP